MELESLKLLVAVADYSSFTRTASRTGITQSSRSKKVQQLEREFNARLLYRVGRGVKLTEAGKKLVELARRMFQSIDSLKEELLASNAKFLGTVTLGLPPSFGATISAALIRRFKKEYPDDNVRVVVAYSGALSDWLDSGRIDVAVLYDVHRSATLLVTPLFNEYLYLVEGAPGAEGQKTTTLSELGVGSYVIPSSENGMRKILDAAATRLSVDMKIMAEIDSLDATKELVESARSVASCH